METTTVTSNVEYPRLVCRIEPDLNNPYDLIYLPVFCVKSMKDYYHVIERGLLWDDSLPFGSYAVVVGIQ